MQTKGPFSLPSNLKDLQQAIYIFEKELADSIEKGKIKSKDALLIYREFHKQVEAQARSISGVELGTTISGRISNGITDMLTATKFHFLNTIFKINNKGVEDMIGAMTISGLRDAFEKRDYICDDSIATAVWMALKLRKPLLLEGDAGVGKTEIAKVLADVLDTDLIRLQCYEGLDENKALYEWNYSKQLLAIQGHGAAESDIFTSEYLLERPLMKALTAPKLPVLLIDEIDKADEEFEAFLLEILSDFQVSIPEIGTVKAVQAPPVILTSNNMRDLSDPLRRRCLFLYINYPSVDKEATILVKKAPGIPPDQALHVAQAMGRIRRDLQLRKNPSIAESIDLAQALVTVRAPKLTPDFLDQLTTLFIKNHDDQRKFVSAGGGAWALK